MKYQLDSSCVIMSSILMTTVFYKAVILQGEIWHWSLLGLKGLNGLLAPYYNLLQFLLDFAAKAAYSCQDKNSDNFEV